MIDDRELEWSYRLQIEMVPTLIECHDGVEQARLVGWLRDEWRSLTGLSTLGDGLPQFSPGCGSRTVEPGMPESLAYKYGNTVLQAVALMLPNWKTFMISCLSVAGPTDCRSCRQPKNASCAC